MARLQQRQNIVKDYWGTDDVVLAFSRQDEGLIAIGTRVPGGESWIHVHVSHLMNIIGMQREYEQQRKNKKLQITCPRCGIEYLAKYSHEEIFLEAIKKSDD